VFFVIIKCMNIDQAVETIISEINKIRKNKNRILVALDGRSGVGKSTLAKLLAEKVNGVIIVSDDFYSGGNDDKWVNYSPEAKVADAIDWKRLRSEALEPLLAGKSASWHPLDFQPEVGWVGWKKESIKVRPTDVVILDGAYAARPELSDLIDIKVLLQLEDKVRRERLQKREGEEFMVRWHKIWDSAEDYYFSNLRPTNSYDLVLDLD
jgi:uridine kinase